MHQQQTYATRTISQTGQYYAYPGTNFDTMGRMEYNPT